MKKVTPGLLAVVCFAFGATPTFADETAPAPKEFSMQFLSGNDFAEADLGESRFYRARLNKSNFSGADLRNATFEQTDCSAVNFTGAKFSDNTSFKQANLTMANFEGVNMQGADFDSVTFRKANLQNTSNWGNLAKINFAQADLRGADFSKVASAPEETIWTGAIFNDATIFPTGVDPAEVGAVKQ